MSISINATLTRGANGQSLVVLHSVLFNGKEIRPGDLRELGSDLMLLADMAARNSVSGKHWLPTTVTLETERKA